MGVCTYISMIKKKGGMSLQESKEFVGEFECKIGKAEIM